jgi:PIN domain nuclease of toxin-antitoxin system
MRALLDTHALLWFVLGDARLSATATDFIQDLASTKLVSPASYWEIAIKISLGKYSLAEPYVDFMRRAVDGNGFEILHIDYRHTAALIDLPLHHRDPFDRLLVAQALVEDIPIVSSDPSLRAYAVRRLW